MKRHIFPILSLAVLATILLSGCGPAAPGEQGTEIVTAREALALVADGAVLVDCQPLTAYRKMHAGGAINISRADIVENDPFPNLVAPAGQIEDVMSGRGIDNDTLVVAYDTNKNMDAARLWWTLKYYGHDKVKVVSGGLEALARAGSPVGTNAPAPTASTFRAGAPRTEMLASGAEIRKRLDDPAGWQVVDTRTEEEFNEGTIPGARLLNFTGNNFDDHTYRPVRQIRIRYLEEGIDYDDTVVMFCKTSIRGTQTYLALYNAGYRDLKLYDGAWVEWSANPMNPVYVPETAAPRLDSSDNS